MKKIVLVSCASRKLDERARAEDLYVSPLFTKNLAYARGLHPDHIFILSAKYGLLTLEQEIEPYNVTLKTMKSNEIRGWANRVLSQLRQHADLESDTFVFLAGMPYRKFLMPHMPHVEVPMEGMPIGKQLQFLTGNTEEGLGDLSEFFDE